MITRTLLAVAFIAVGRTSFAEPVAVFTDEHVDINVGYSGGNSFSVAFRDDDLGVQYKSDNAVVSVPKAALVARTAGSAFDFIGVPAGAQYYRLPQGQNPSIVYLGLAASGVAAGAIDSYDPSLESGGRVTGVGAWTRLQVVGSSGPGMFSVWQAGTTPRVFVSSLGGLDPSDSVWVRAGSHVHYNYGFSAPGEYRVRVVPSAFQAGVQRTGCPIDLFFRVDIPTTVALVRGTVELLDYTGKVSSVPLTVDLRSGGALVESQTVFPSCDGSFSLHTLNRGSFDVSVKAPHWLRKRTNGVSIGNDGGGGLQFQLTNGDIDGDNTVTVFDYGVLSDYFDSSSSDLNWYVVGPNGFAPRDADLDGDGGVTVFDYGVLSDAFDLVGDE